MRTGHGTEQAERGTSPRRDRAGEAAPEALAATLAASERRSVDHGAGEPGAGNLSRVVRTLLDALRYYAEDGNDAGEKARRALQLHKGMKYVS